MKRGGQTFAEVLKGLREGKMYERSAWERVGMFIFMQRGAHHITMSTREGHTSKWLISHGDVLADDWHNVLDKEVTL